MNWQQARQTLAALLSHLHHHHATVLFVGLTGNEAVAFKRVDEAGHGCPGNAGGGGEIGRRAAAFFVHPATSIGLFLAKQEHQDAKTPVREAETGKIAVRSGKGNVASPQQVQVRHERGGIQVWIVAGIFEQALEARQVLEQQGRHEWSGG